MGKNPSNLTHLPKPPDPFVRPPTCEHIYGRIRLILFFFYSGFEWPMGFKFLVAYPPDHLITHKKKKKNLALKTLTLSRSLHLTIFLSPSHGPFSLSLSPLNPSHHTCTPPDSTTLPPHDITLTSPPLSPLRSPSLSLRFFDMFQFKWIYFNFG